MFDSYGSRLAVLEKRISLRFGIVTEVDYEGTAEWNPKGYIPSALVCVQDIVEIDSPATRIIAIGSRKDEGFWWPIQKGSVVSLGFQTGMETPVILGTLWSDDHGTPPTEANEDTVVMKWNGHLFQIKKGDTESGFTIQTQNGLKLLLQETEGKFSAVLENPAGTKIDMDSSGNLAVTASGNLSADVTGNLSASVKGNVDIQADGSSTYQSKGIAKIKSDVQVTLETLGALGDLITTLTHSRDYVTGQPIIGNPTLKGG